MQATAKATEFLDTSSSDSVLWSVSPEMAALEWHRFEPLLAPAIAKSHGMLNTASVKHDLACGHMQLWAAFAGGWDDEVEAVAVTEIRKYVECTVLGMPLVGGKSRERWLHFEGALTQFAAAHGCDYIEGYVRKGWAPDLKLMGWLPLFETWRKPVNGR